MLVEDILLKVRSRLKDVDYSDLRFSDNELIDCLNCAISYLIGTYDLHIKTREITLDSTQKEMFIPYILKIKSAYFNNQPINSRTNMQKAHNESLSLLIKNDFISVTPFKEGCLKISFSDFIPLSDTADEVPLPFVALGFLVYSTLCQILEINTQDENYQKIGFFTQMKQSEETNIIAYLNRIYAPPLLRSKVVRV